MSGDRWRWELADARAVVYLVLFLGLLVWFFSGCMRVREGRVAGAVTALAEVVDPTYALAMNGCIEAERALVEAEKAGRQLEAVTGEKLAVVRARCDRLRLAFDAIVDLLVLAEQAVKDGATDKAEALRMEARGRWLDSSTL